MSRFFGYTNTADSAGGSRRSGAREAVGGGRARSSSLRPLRDVKQIYEFEEHDIVDGVVRAVTDFGIFIDIGAVRDARLPWTQVSGPTPVVGEKLVDLAITSVDTDRQRIGVAFVGKGSEDGDIYFFAKDAKGKSRGSGGSAMPFGGGKGKGGGRKGKGKGLDELEVGDEVSGTVRNVTEFGIFVDIGAVKDGLISSRNVPHHLECDKGTFLNYLEILDLDRERERISLGVLEEDSKGDLVLFQPAFVSSKGKGKGGKLSGRALEDFMAGDRVSGTIRSVMEFGVFVDIGAVKDGLLAMRNVPDDVDYQKGDVIEDLCILDIDVERERISLGLLEEDSDGCLRPPMRQGKGGAKGDTFKGNGFKGEKGSGVKGGLKGDDFKGKGKGKFMDDVDVDSDYSDDSLDVNSGRGADPKGPLRELETVKEGEVVEGRVIELSADGPVIDFGCQIAGIVPNELVDIPFCVGDMIMALRVTEVDIAEELVFLEPLEDDDDFDLDIMPGSAAAQPRRMTKQLPVVEEFPVIDTLDKRPGVRGRSGQRLDLPRKGASGKGRNVGDHGCDEDELLATLAPGMQSDLVTHRTSQHNHASDDEDDDVEDDGEQEGNDEVEDDEDEVEEEGEEDEEGGGPDLEEVRAMLECLTLGDKVEGVVAEVTDQGAWVNFGCLVSGLLPQRLIDWPVREGDELSELVISKINLDSGQVTLGIDDSEVDAEKVKAIRASAAAGGGSGRGRGRGRGRGGCGGDETVDRKESDEGVDNTLEASRNSDMKTSKQRFADGTKPLQETGAPNVAPLLQKIAAGQRSAARELAKAVACAPQPIQTCAIASAALKVLMRENSCAAAALLGLQELNEKLGRISEPLMTRVIPAVLDKYGDRQRSVQVAAEDCAETIVARLNPFAIDTVLPSLLNVLKQKEKTEIKSGVLRMLSLMRDEDTIRPLARKLHQIVPSVAEMLLDVKKDVRESAKDAALVLFECAQNKDLNPYLEEIVDALMDMKEIPKCVDKLSEIVFVQTVETQALAIVMPLITRGLKDRDERTKRRSLVIADNMCKLVPTVTEIQPFLPVLIPLVDKARNTISDPEVRNVAERCYETLEQAEKADRRRAVDKNVTMKLIRDKVPETKREVVLEMMIDYIAHLCIAMSFSRAFDYFEWWQCIAPYLTPHFLTKEQCEELVPELLEYCYDVAEGDDVEDSDEEGEDLCNCVFTLGYGALTLLNNTRLHLKRGECYGLCGPNDCGKSTLLRAINNEQVDGFPPKSELVTAYVEHGIGEKEPESEWTPLEYMFADETIQAMQIPKKKVVAAMRSLGFENEKLKQELGHLSGGWKMKLGLVRAMLMCADILLLDEPTGHLDVTNVAWLAEYVESLKNDPDRPVTTIVVSHDTGFMDKVCTHVINVRQRKLKTYRGNITDFVRRCPEAKSYLTLTNEKQKFVLPEPGMLEGVKSKGKKLLKMHNVTFTYPGCATPVLHDVSIEVSLLSRVAVIGPNGAGKSTMIKALVGELAVGKGTVWKHPNVRISYVAQHAFHHVENHLDETATQYILDRFAGGEDREALDFRAEEQQVKRKQYYFKDDRLVKCVEPADEKKAVKPEAILGRRKSKAMKSAGAGTDDSNYEYQVKWLGSSVEAATWVVRDKLVEMGALRMVQREDERQAAAHGLLTKPLTRPEAEKHLLNFGLEASFASHQRIGVLSGGQKVKVVLGAATWLSPHILILDEPTNFLDRDSLGALANGLKDFGGGVIIISHNREFANAVATERWCMDAGYLTREGETNPADVKIEKTLGPEYYVDEHGNRSVFERKKELTDKERKKYKKMKEQRRKKGEEVSESEDDWWEKLREQVAAPVPGMDAAKASASLAP